MQMKLWPLAGSFVFSNGRPIHRHLYFIHGVALSRSNGAFILKFRLFFPICLFMLVFCVFLCVSVGRVCVRAALIGDWRLCFTLWLQLYILKTDEGLYTWWLKIEIEPKLYYPAYVDIRIKFDLLDLMKSITAIYYRRPLPFFSLSF